MRYVESQVVSANVRPPSRETPIHECRPHQEGEPWQLPYSSPPVTHVASGTVPSGDAVSVVAMSNTQL
jgi:hypothetical protein